MAKSKRLQNKVPEAVIIELRSLLDPNKIVHDSARSGAEALLRLSDNVLYRLFCSLVIDNEPPPELIQQLPPDFMEGVSSNDLIAALRRLSILGIKLAEQVQADTETKPKPRKALQTDSKPMLPLDEHIQSAKTAKKDMDCLTKMAALASALEQQFETLYTYPARQAQPFMGVRSVNMVAQTYMAALERLHRMQVDTGIVEKKPEQMEINMRQAGAFQTYVGEMSADHKQAMIDFSDHFCSFLSKKAKRGSHPD